MTLCRRGTLVPSAVGAHRVTHEPVALHIAIMSMDPVSSDVAGAGSGESDCQRLALAATFELENHPHDDLSKGYTVVRIDHEIHQVVARLVSSVETPTYKNRFHCVPERVAFRPDRPRRELHQITETATVVGPSGEEIHVDAHGRIKVQFHWGNTDPGRA